MWCQTAWWTNLQRDSGDSVDFSVEVAVSFCCLLLVVVVVVVVLVVVVVVVVVAGGTD